MFLHNSKEIFEKEFMKFVGSKLSKCHKKNIQGVPKNSPFRFSKAFLKEYPVILIMIPQVWTEEMKLFALHIYSTK